MNNELLAVFEYLERERGLDRETLIRMVEESILAASEKSLLQADDLRISIDRKAFDVRALATCTVVDRVRDPAREVALLDARRTHPNVHLGERIQAEITPRNFGRIAAQAARQAILQRLRQAEGEIIFEEFKDRPGDIVSGAVRRFERSDLIVELGRAEAILPAAERVPTEIYQIGDRVRAYILRVESRPYGPEIVLSRSHPDFVRRLFELEVSEIADRTVEIKGIAREAGFRTKIAVLSHDERVDPVGACVGMRGMRVKNIVRELGGEKIDIVRWSDDTRTLIANSLAPAKLSRIDIDEATRTVTVTVAGDQLSLAIGKKGQNARLTAKLTGWRVDIEREAEEVSFEEKVAQAIANLAKVEGIGAERAEALVHAGFLTVEGLLAADPADLEDVEGVDATAAAEVHAAAEKAYEQEHGSVES